MKKTQLHEDTINVYGITWQSTELNQTFSVAVCSSALSMEIVAWSSSAPRKWLPSSDNIGCEKNSHRQTVQYNVRKPWSTAINPTQNEPEIFALKAAFSAFKPLASRSRCYEICKWYINQWRNTTNQQPKSPTSVTRTISFCHALKWEWPVPTWNNARSSSSSRLCASSLDCNAWWAVSSYTTPYVKDSLVKKLYGIDNTLVAAESFRWRSTISSFAYERQRGMIESIIRNQNRRNLPLKYINIHQEPKLPHLHFLDENHQPLWALHWYPKV